MLILYSYFELLPWYIVCFVLVNKISRVYLELCSGMVVFSALIYKWLRRCCAYLWLSVSLM